MMTAELKSSTYVPLIIPPKL